MVYDLADGGTIQNVDTTLAYQYWRVTGTTSNVPNTL